MLRRLSPTRWSLILATVIVGTVSLRAEVVPETRLKAAFISKFPQFVEWPRTALDGRQTIDICVASSDPFLSDIQDLLSGEVLGGRTFAVRRVEGPADVTTCHLLFLPGRAGNRNSFLAAASNRPILTVSDAPGFLDAGGIVGLRVVDGRVRFEIDDGAARRAGLRISSQLLRLAVNVRGGAA